MRVGLSLAMLVLALAGLPAQVPVTFTDVTPAGIRFVHNNGATGKKYLPETMGSGAIFFDENADGWQDLLLINSTKFPGEGGEVGFPKFYRNDGDGTFTDITQGSGLDVELVGMGGAAGDFDNDGRVDVYVTAYGGGRLFRNLGGGKFADVTVAAGVSDREWSTSAMWVDYDKDGSLDLLVARYVDWRPQTNRGCEIPGKGKVYCTPKGYRGFGSVLFRNRGDGTFANVTAPAGVAQRNSRDLGVAMLDFDGDGWIDLFVASDTTVNRLYRNSGSGTFVDVGQKAGVATTPEGGIRAGMGVDAGDYDGSGRPGIIVGNFSNEMMAMYRNEGGGLFVDEARTSAVGRDSRLSLTFGLFFFDYDLDGRLDIFAANGHISDLFPGGMENISYAQKPHLFHNLGNRRFAEAIGSVGSDLARPVVGRGAAYADIDRDGDLDLVMTENHGAARLYRNDAGAANHSLRITLTGRTSNRSAVGARVDLTRDDGSVTWAIVKTGSSYLSQSELPLTFGLGQASRVRALKVTWPSGRVDSIDVLDADQELAIQEGMGVTARTPLRRRSR